MSHYQTVYDVLRKGGMTEAAALGMLGNLQQESGCEPWRLQGDFDSFRRASKDYVERIDSGRMTVDEFCKPVGFGLAQWTMPERKRNLWNFWKIYGGSIADTVMQAQFILCELTKEPEYSSLWSFLKTTNDTFLATSQICRFYERPAYNNIDARFQSAKDIKAQIDLNDWQAQSSELTDGDENLSSENSQNLILESEYWPPRVICKGMAGADVEVLQSVLKAQGLIMQNADGIFGSFLEEKVKAFQTAHNLDVDGIVGPKTWAEVLKM